MKNSIFATALTTAVIAIVLAACAAGTPGGPDTPPTFDEAIVTDRRYLVTSVTCTLALPEATGGNGDLSYTLTPTGPNWNFDATTRILSVSPTTAGTWDIVYRVHDADANTDDGDTDTLTFTITITHPSDSDPPTEGIASTYQGCGNQVFFLNADGQGMADELYTLMLDAVSADVYLIATNTTTDAIAPTIEPLHLAARSPAIRRGVDWAAVARHSDTHGLPHSDHSRTEFGPSSLLPATVTPSAPEPRQSAREGDEFTFWDTYPSPPQQVHAIARRVVTDGTTSAVFWVSAAAWGTCRHCITQEMIDAIADDFLKSGPANDVHDWVTAIFGAPWGPYPEPGSGPLIPPEFANELHILFVDSDEEYAAYYTGAHVFLRAGGSPHSNERQMIFMNTRNNLPAEKDLEAFRRFRGSFARVLAHEYQHLIRYYQKSVLNEFMVDDDAWLNEMASELADEFVSYKVMTSGYRGLPYDDPTAGRPPILGGYYAWYNYYNYLRGTYFESDVYYATNFVLGAYLTYTYGGAPLMGAIAQNEYDGVESIEAAIVELGYPPTSFGEVLTNFAVANLLSDDTDAPYPYRFNSGEWTESEAGGITFRLGSVNLFNYRWQYGEDPDAFHDGPYFFSVEAFNAEEQAPRANRYVHLGPQTGTLQLRLNAPEGARITVVVKE